MTHVREIALSGLAAAMLQFEASARNIANANTTGATSGGPGARDVYAPLEVVQSPRAGGGDNAKLTPTLRAALLVHDPSAPYADVNGDIAAANVDPVGDMLQLMTAKQAFSANLAVLRAEAEAEAATLEVLA